MFEPFPGHYVWNLSINLALAQGAAIGEIDEGCRPLIGAEPDSEQLFASLCAIADRVRRQADADVTAGHALSAATRYRRASIYYLKIEAPLLVVHGGNDRQVSPAMAQICRPQSTSSRTGLLIGSAPDDS
ncbi:hypothetical protein [Nocardia cerradoensis]|uniref:Uncharacterized protein n=1 Tax=Nocardia cerradoensis TaxID=85688 RepID=A0A231GZQ0_9NOCA|nr:hypothetical protein [Nocardia cerradoensis]NKY41899.1 hypothetical protein [Nocardia cerradoensis]OXR42083.1 hypothetical protein B7C42_05682 [Nocardia cerradoensis]